MKGFRKALLFIVIVLTVVAAASFWLALRRGFSARDEPTAVEAFVARRLRHLAIPAGARETRNPVAASDEVLREALAHFADHCAICHANDGSGDTDIGRSLYPPAPDMREESTQSLSDGELFYVIHNGVRFTGMPAWGGEDPAEDQDSWKLAHFIRRLPKITREEIAEMERLNPKSVHRAEEEESVREFLEGGGEEETHGHGGHHHH